MLPLGFYVCSMKSIVSIGFPRSGDFPKEPGLGSGKVSAVDAISRSAARIRDRPTREIEMAYRREGQRGRLQGGSRGKTYYQRSVPMPSTDLAISLSGALPPRPRSGRSCGGSLTSQLPPHSCAPSSTMRSLLPMRKKRMM